MFFKSPFGWRKTNSGRTRPPLRTSRKSLDFWALRLERLEDRTVLSTVSISGGTLYYAAGSEANDLTIDQSGGILDIQDNGATIAANPADGFTIINAHEVQV